MTYIIIIDGFTNEGWKNIYTLFEPSFYADDMRIYYASDPYASSEIQELMPRDQKHHFIFMSMQRDGYQGEEKLNTYRYKQTIELIKRTFPYYMEHHNTLLVLDHASKELGSSRYRELEKRVAYELDKQGYLSDNTTYPYLFSADEIVSLDAIYNAYTDDLDIQTIVSAEKKKMLDELGQKITELFTKKKNLCKKVPENVISSQALCDIEKMLRERIASIKDNGLRKPHNKPALFLTSLLEERYSVKQDLENFGIIQYGYRDEIDTALFLKIGSLLSVLVNAQRELPSSYWLEITTFSLDEDLIEQRVKQMEGLCLEEPKEQAYTIKLNDLKMISLPKAESNIEYPIEIKAPLLYSRVNEEKLQGQIESHHQMIVGTIEMVQSEMKKTKKEIHTYHVDKKEYTLSKEEIIKSIESGIKPPAIDYGESIADITQAYKRFEHNDFKKRVIHEIRKLPSMGKVLLLFVFFFMITSLPYAAPFLISSATPIVWDKWYEHVFPLVTIGFFWLTVWGYLYVFKQKLSKLLKNHQNFLLDMVSRIKNWQEKMVKKHSILYEKKIAYENFQILQQKYTEIKAIERERHYHEKHIAFIRGQVGKIKTYYTMHTVPDENKYRLKTADKSPNRIMEYALFDEKVLVREIHIGSGKLITDIMAYGAADYIKTEIVLSDKNHG